MLLSLYHTNHKEKKVRKFSVVPCESDELMCSVTIYAAVRTNWIPFDDMPCKIVQILVDTNPHEGPFAILMVKFADLETRNAYVTNEELRPEQHATASTEVRE